MTDTDDTDVLLNIPPSTFIHTPSESETETVEFKRIKRHKKKQQISNAQSIAYQVSKLKLSLEKLENVYHAETSTDDIVDKEKPNYSLKAPSDNPYDLYSSSDSSAISYLSITSAINMENVVNDTTLTPKKDDKLILNEIDTFLKNIESTLPDVDQYSFIETPKLNTSYAIVKKDLSSLKDGDETFKSSTADSVFTSDFISKHLNKWTPNKDNTLKTDIEKKIRRTSYTGDGYLETSVPDYGFGVRDLFYSKDRKEIEIPLSARNVSNVSCGVVSSTLSNKDDDIVMRKTKSETLQRIHNSQNSRRRLKMDHSNGINEPIIETKSLLSHETSTPNIKKFPLIESDFRSLDLSDISEANIPKKQEIMNIFENLNLPVGDDQPHSLPSLSNLWSTTDVRPKTDLTDLQKFKEERIRREHCEQQIQDLQQKILEQQQKLAIAVQVDSVKDEAITKLKNAITKMMKKVEEDELKYIQQMEALKVKSKTLFAENEELKKKVDDYKKEVDGAHKHVLECQEKYKTTIEDKNEVILKLQTEIDSFDSVLKKKDDMYNELKESNALAVQLNKQISESLSDTKTGMDKLTEENERLIKDIRNIKKQAETLEDEIFLLKSEKKELSSKISEEAARNAHLESQKMKLQAMLDSGSLKYKSLEMEYESLKQQMDSQKEEVKLHYQNQVETIVMAKVNEFQNQLNAAESLMDSEIRNKEKEIAMQFAKQLHKSEQQHKSEISILEEKHKEEIKLYRLQLAQSSRTINQLESNLNSYKNKRGQIAAQLHSIMENQWKEALKVITNSTNSDYSAECLAIHTKNPNRSVNSKDFVMDVSREKEHDDHPERVSKESKLDKSQADLLDEPISTGGENIIKEEEIHNYVKMLLQRTPGVSDILRSTHDTQKKDKSKIPHSSYKMHKYHEDDFPTSDQVFCQDKKFDKRLPRKPWK